MFYTSLDNVPLNYVYLGKILVTVAPFYYGNKNSFFKKQKKFFSIKSPRDVFLWGMFERFT